MRDDRSQEGQANLPAVGVAGDQQIGIHLSEGEIGHVADDHMQLSPRGTRYFKPAIVGMPQRQAGDGEVAALELLGLFGHGNVHAPEGLGPLVHLDVPANGEDPRGGLADGVLEEDVELGGECLAIR